MAKRTDGSELVNLERRAVLGTLGAIGAAIAFPHAAPGGVVRRISLSGNPFTLGVASGDPTSDGVVLWTRLAPEPLTGGGMPAETVAVDWQVAADEGMRRVLRRGTAVAQPRWGHSVHVEVEGLAPDRWYWYQFRVGDYVSPIGRTRTMPLPSASPERLRFAFVSCQHYETGLFTGYEHMAREDLDLVVHLGDYIYEGAGANGQLRKHVGPLLKELDHYRNRHAQYKTDPALQAMHAAAPWIVTPDDHEFANNCAGFISERPSDDPAEYRSRRAHAYQAYWEHMPLRRRSLPQGPDMRLYRRLPFGTLANFLVLDTRQYRSDQPCGDGNKPPCPESLAPTQSLMGTAQRDWFFRRLDRTPCRWNILAQQVMMGRADRAAGDAVTHSMDQWPGYEFERRRVLRYFRDHRVPNPIVLTGDIHTNWANELAVDFDGRESAVVAAEFVGTSISSGGDGRADAPYLPALYSENPFVKFHNAQRGYVRCEVSQGVWRTDYRTLDYVTRPGSPIRTAATFLLEPGSSKLIRA